MHLTWQKADLRDSDLTVRPALLEEYDLVNVLALPCIEHCDFEAVWTHSAQDECLCVVSAWSGSNLGLAHIEGMQGVMKHWRLAEPLGILWSSLSR